MRLRFNKKAVELLNQDQDFFVQTSEVNNLNPNQLFNNNHPIHLEIGSGKGDFIIQMAVKYPDINFIGLEKNETVLAKALKKAQQVQHLTNLKLISCDAKELLTLFMPHKFDQIYLNFSDPWPKARHEKRRLTHPNFLKIYQTLLINDNCHIEFKSDNDSLYDYTYELLNTNQDKYIILYHTTDLYHHLDEYNNANNVATEYEKKFHSLNKNIYKIVFSYK